MPARTSSSGAGRGAAEPGIAAVIAAGGAGTRVGRATPKQFLPLAGVPILARTVRRFARHPRIGLVVVAAPPDLVDRSVRVLRRHLPSRAVSPLASPGAPAAPVGARILASRRARVIVLPGGAERQDSVARGLEAVPAGIDLVLVHDAVRPFVTAALIDRVIAAAAVTGAAICALPIAETVKRVRDAVVEGTVDRTGLWAVQTPQGFRAALLREAHDKARRDAVTGTDESTLVERLGHPVRVVDGLVENIKITTPADLGRARERTRR
jgi:2-C-methyl-D-erythritol 4-phosphate cytidylyltransferase